MFFSLPPQTYVHKNIPKTKFFEKAVVSSKLRREFAAAVQRITWEHKLAPDTINIAATREVEEIQIFHLSLKEKKIPKKILRFIDRAIPYPILYIFTYGEHKAYGISLRGLIEDRYYFSEWDEKMEFYFTHNNLEKLYQGLIKAFIKDKPTESQDFATIVLTDKERERLEREIVVLKNKLKKEPQFNRKVEINTKLQSVQLRLKALTNPA